MRVSEGAAFKKIFKGGMVARGPILKARYGCRGNSVNLKSGERERGL
jgi:hypothetical protein